MDSTSLASGIRIKSKFHDYEVCFQEFSLPKKPAVVVADSIVRNLYFPDQSIVACTVESDEDIKTLATVENVLNSMSDCKMSKSDRLFVVGGGVLQDVGTLAASIYKRGIPWTFVPTTLQAMIDSCIGGKSSINLGPYKNLLGNFYPPSEVLIDIRFLSTLSDLDLVCGLIEGAKICAAASHESLRNFLQIAETLSIPYKSVQKDKWAELIHYALSQKKKFVEKDEFDQGIRKLLNFGHTFGHAIESSADYQIPHGIAVGLGILMATNLSQARGNSLEDESLSNYIRRIISPFMSNFAQELRSMNSETFLDFLGQDKKAGAREYVFVIPERRGLVLISLPMNDSTRVDIMKVVTDELERWK